MSVEPGGDEGRSWLEDQSWAALAACADEEPDALFVRGAAQRVVRELCFRCPVRLPCLAEAMTTDVSFGVWGGLTERERRALRRQHPDVTDWASWLRREGGPEAAELRADRPPRVIARARARLGAGGLGAGEPPIA